MVWRRSRTGSDPLLTNHHWRVTIRKHWQVLRLPCARCHRAIDYDGLRYLITTRGRRILNPRYLVVGHIVDRYQAKRLGWTEQQINAITNTQPECQDCSNRSGARLGQRVQRQRTKINNAVLDNSRRW
jgi:hypothetical protein